MQSPDNQNGQPHGQRAPGSDASSHAHGLQTTGAYPEAATDFLGLDQDVAASAPNAGVPADGSGAAFDTSSSWLLSIEEGGAPNTAQGATQTAPQTQSPFTAGQATVSGPERELVPEWQTSAEPEHAASTEGSGDVTHVPQRKRSRSTALLVTAGILGVLCAGGWYGWQWWQEQQLASQPEVANAPAPRPKPNVANPNAAKPNPAPRTTPANPAVAATPLVETAPAPVDATPPETTSASSDATHDAAATTAPAPNFEFGPRTSDARVDAFVRSQFGGDESLPAGTRPETSPFATIGSGSLFQPTGAHALPGGNGSSNPTSNRVTRIRGRGSLRVASADDLSGIWDGTTVPVDAIDKDARLLTPEVGRVRATIFGGEIFEGRLYAVGQQQIQLDTELGRMTLLSSQVQKIDQISSRDGTPVLGEKGSQYLAGLPRVRVRTAGGMLYGKVVNRDETSLTLITDGGARIRVDATEFEPAPDANAVIVRSTRRAAP